jgi:hypothetical protein
MRLHGIFGLDGTPRAVLLVGADRPEREVALQMLPGALRGGEIVSATRTTPAATSPQTSTHSAPPCSGRPAKTSPTADRGYRCCASASSRSSGPARTSSRSSVTARAPCATRARIAQRLLAPTACIHLNHRLRRPSPALVDFVAQRERGITHLGVLDRGLHDCGGATGRG